MTNNLDKLRHSCSHLLAAAVTKLWPQAKPTLGPPIEDGFYYDFDNLKISEEDLPKIEKEMFEIVKGWNKFEKIEVENDEAINRFKNNEYKKELIREHSGKGEKITLYKSGTFIDLCRGGHVDSPKDALAHFKLLSIAGAYWRGDEKNKMLTRIYGTIFPTAQELEAHLKMLEETKKRDHRKLGRELDLFSTSPLTGPGLILWHPKLAISRILAEQFWREEHLKNDYQFVFTPHIASMDMFVISRHYIKYINYMFPAMLHQYIEGESAPDYVTDEQLKPMNCPNHIQIYKSKPKSYRDLPIRMAELGTVYRYERAGTLLGMTRVRGFTQDDSHIFCRPDQVVDELRKIIRLTKHIYEIFGFKDFQAYLATRPETYLGTSQMWDTAQESLRKALEAEKIDFKIDEGQGVFYGPKIDSKIKDSLGREWQLGTIQVDFNLPSRSETSEKEIEDFWALKTFKDKFKSKEKLAHYLKKLGRGFGVNYVNKEGKEEQAVMIHRTVYGSMERFFGILIEHYAGAFPVWLSPVQVKVLPITERNLKYAKEVTEKLKNEKIRVELDDRNETLQAKIRDAQLAKVPYILIIGDREEKNKKVALRLRTEEDLGPVELDKFVKRVKDKIDSKSQVL